MNKLELTIRIVLLALGWLLVAARGISVGLDAGTLWSGGGMLAVTLSLGLVRWMDQPPTDREAPAPERLPWSERFFASLPGRIVGILAVAIQAIGMGSIVGPLVCVPVLGLAETTAALPELLGPAALGATLSVVGFVILTVVSALLGPILSSVYEAWIAYIAPVIGGVASAVLEIRASIDGPIGEILESGPIARGILVVGISAVVGGLVSPISLAIVGTAKDRLKHVDQEIFAGMGFGAINGLILALILGVLRMLR